MQKRKITSINRLLLGTAVWIWVVPLVLARVLTNLSSAQSLIASQILYLIPVFGYIIFHKISIRQWVPLQKIKLSTFFMAILFALLLIPLVSCVNLISMLFVTNHVAESTGQMQSNSFFLNLLCLAVIPAISEEFMFRGIYYHAYRDKGIMIGVFGSGLAFGMVHLNFNQFCYALVLGVAFCFLVEATGSIFSSMAAHFAINGWSVLSMVLLEPLQKLTESMGQETSAGVSYSHQELLLTLAVYGILALITTSLAVCVLIWIARHCNRLEHMKWCVTQGKYLPGLPKTFVTPSWILAAVLYAAYMLIQELLT